MKRYVFVTFLAILLSAGTCSALIHDLFIRNDARNRFFIENFGFEAGGILNLTVENFALSPGNVENQADYKVGFLITKTETDSDRFLEESELRHTCLLEDTDLFDFATDSVVRLDTWSEKRFIKQIAPGQEGFYNVYFVNCEEHTKANFEALLTMYNEPGRNYLPAGERKLPAMYAAFFLMYVAVAIVWVGNYLRNDADKKVLNIHYLMTVVLMLKIISVFFQAVELHFLNIDGHPGGWAIIYFIFTSLRGIMLFVVILLIGTGWSFVKPFLSEQDKKIFLIVIPLQILDNIAMIIIEETAPGSQGFFTWKDIFRLVDIICCGAILVPIIWSIRHLREAAQIDGKAARNIQKLKLFRQFYLLVVSYIYFTRVIVYLLDATLPFRYVWLGNFFTEIAALSFYLIVGYRFRPISNNPHFNVDDADLFDTIEL